MNEMEWDKALCYLLGSIVAKYYDEYVCVCVCVCVCRSSIYKLLANYSKRWTDKFDDWWEENTEANVAINCYYANGEHWRRKK